MRADVVFSFSGQGRNQWQDSVTCEVPCGPSHSLDYFTMGVAFVQSIWKSGLCVENIPGMRLNSESPSFYKFLNLALNFKVYDPFGVSFVEAVKGSSYVGSNIKL